MEISGVRQRVWELMQQYSMLVELGEDSADTQGLVFHALAAVVQPGERPLAYADRTDTRRPDADVMAYGHEAGSPDTDAYAYPHGEATAETDAFFYPRGPETRETDAFAYAAQDTVVDDVLGYEETPRSPENDAMLSAAEGHPVVSVDVLLLTDLRLSRVMVHGTRLVLAEAPAGCVDGMRLLLKPTRDLQSETLDVGPAPARMAVRLPRALIRSNEHEWWTWKLRPGRDPWTAFMAWRGTRQ